MRWILLYRNTSYTHNSPSEIINFSHLNYKNTNLFHYLKLSRTSEVSRWFHSRHKFVGTVHYRLLNTVEWLSHSNIKNMIVQKIHGRNTIHKFTIWLWISIIHHIRSVIALSVQSRFWIPETTSDWLKARMRSGTWDFMCSSLTLITKVPWHMVDFCQLSPPKSLSMNCSLWVRHLDYNWVTRITKPLKRPQFYKAYILSDLADCMIFPTCISFLHIFSLVHSQEHSDSP